MGLLLGVSVPVQAQVGEVRVAGTVTSSEGAQPLPGASVVVKGTNIGTLTATNGRYALSVPNPNDTLVFTFIGYATQEVPIGGRSIVNVVMPVEAIALQELVVTGYGIQQKRDVTGAVTSLDAEDLTDLPAAANVAQTLQGRVAGVQVTPASGAPGDSSVIRIRGVGTLNDASPLFVVDGMLLDDISFLNSKDIQSVEVLKDASATAIYGSRGANGVIIITTKRGVVDRPTRFTFRSYVGSQSVLDEIDLVNARQYATLANEVAGNEGQSTLPFPDPDTITTNTDWQGLIFETAPVQSYALSASGGTEKVAYYFSADLFRQSGVVPKSDFNRFTLRANNDYHLTDHVLLGHNLAFSYTEGQRPPGILSEIYRADPTVPPGDPESGFNDAGQNASAGNPAAALFYTRNDDQGSRLVGNLFAEANLDRFTLRSSFGLDFGTTRFRNFGPVFFVSPQQQRSVSTLDVRTTRSTSWLWENTLTFNYVADRHRVTALAGITAQSVFGEELGCGRTGIVGDDESLWFCNAGSTEGQTNTNGVLADWNMLSYLFRTNYTFKDRYLLTASLRIDGSSRFGEENRYGTFPSFAVGWNVSDEPFLQGSEAISALKLRLSWGKIGNDKIGNYPAIPLVSSNLNAVFGDTEDLKFGATTIALANPLVQWEETSQTNLGADMAFFDGRLEATLDYYNRTTDGILVQIPIPSFSGVPGRELPFQNVAEVQNSGFETAFNWRDTWGSIDYELGFNGSTINNEVKSLGPGQNQILGAQIGGLGFLTRTVVGQPIGCFWGLQVDGVFQDASEIAAGPLRGGEVPGDLRYRDIGGRDSAVVNMAGDTIAILDLPDGVVRDGDDRTFVGCPIPDFVYGFHTRINVGRFDFSAAFSGQLGNEVFNAKKARRFETENFETSFLDRWTGPGTSTTEPRITNTGRNYILSDRFIESGAFLKMQSAQIGYRLPPSVTQPLRIAEARLYVSGTNLFQSSDYTGYTPELTAGSVIASGIDQFEGVFPPARTFTVGLDVTF